jgi:N,N'-diacetylchitobiose transport system permease protein
VLGVSIVFTAVFAPGTLWMLRRFVAGVPAELEDAAIADGRVTSRVDAFLQSTPELTLPI